MSRTLSFKPSFCSNSDENITQLVENSGEVIDRRAECEKELLMDSDNGRLHL